VKPKTGDRRPETDVSGGRRMAWCALVVAVFGLRYPVSGFGQCPDGSPPPCARGARAAAPVSLAVLPFESVGGDTANIYFAQGLADELTTALSRVPGLRVAASSSAFTFGSGRVDPLQVGRSLRVGAVLQGRVRREGTRLRVVAQLTRTTNGLLMWSNSYEREVRDVFAVQDDLTRDIVGALRVTLAGGQPAPAPAASRGSGTTNLDAYDLYLRGTFFLSQRGAGVAQSIPYFQRAIALDSGFARAWAQLGQAWIVLPLFSSTNRDSAVVNARAAIARALTLDPVSADAVSARGFLHAFSGDFSAAIADFERAISIDSASTFAHRATISTWLMLGRPDDAVREARRTLELDPLNAVTASVATYALTCARQFEEAVQVGRHGLASGLSAPMINPTLAIAELYAGHHDEAVDALRHAGLVPNTSVNLAYMVGATASRDSAEDFARRLEGERGHNASAWAAIAFVWLGARDTTRALDALEHMVADHEPVVFQNAFSHPAYDVVRHSPRFAAVVRSYGVDERWFTR
jgi:TolB-like protein/tetratricopeptide (TPR) repeat protein